MTTAITPGTETAKDRLQSYLREHGVCFTLRHHTRAFTAQQVAACEHIPGDQLAKPVVVVADGRKVMVVVPASYVVDMTRLAHALQVNRVQLADEEDLAATFSDCEVGALSPFGNLYGLDVYVDGTVASDEHIEFRAGTHTDTIGIEYTEFARLVEPKLIDVARHR